jgi:DNA-directed RNA polymerase specialized sigma24 family protein
VIILARLDGLPTPEIARKLGMSEESVRQMLSRGLKRLRKTMGPTESLRLPDAGLRRDDPDEGATDA